MTAKIFIMHIPKTGGTSVREALERYHSEHVQAGHEHKLIANFDRSKRIFIGHFNYGIHKTLGVENAVYCTFLREPVSRVVSHYYYVKNRREDPYFERANRYSLEEYVQRIEEVQNNQAKKIINDFDTNRLSAERVIDHLKSKFLFVGLTENIDEISDLFFEAIGLPNTLVRHRNSRNWLSKMKDQLISKKTIDTIKEYNRIDIEVYEECKKLGPIVNTY